MQIDWFTLIAQLVNFLVLVGLLRYFLYDRIVRAMNEREATIAARLNEAARKRTEAEEEADRFRVKNRELDEQRETLLIQAQREADERRRQLIETARGDVDRLRTQWLDGLRHEQREFLRDFREQTGRQIFAIVRRVLQDLADADLERQIATGLLRRLEHLAPQEKQALLEAARAPEAEVEWRTAFEPDPVERERVKAVLREQLSDSAAVRFVTDPALLCGVELRADAHQLTWNVESYLEALEDRFLRHLEEKERHNGRGTENGTR